MDRRAGRDGVGQRRAVLHALGADEDVDVLTDAAALVADVEADARRALLERGEDLGDRRAGDLDLLSLEVREELVEVACQFDAGPASDRKSVV